MDETVTLSVSLPRAAKERLDAIALSLGRTTGEIAGEVVASYVESEADAWQVDAIREAVERADAGGPFYGNDDMMAYLEARARGEKPERPKSFVKA
jgi:predicted transcriptional regulator